MPHNCFRFLGFESSGAQANMLRWVVTRTCFCRQPLHSMPSLFTLQYYGDAEAYEYVLGELIPEALGEMTSLTDLSLAVHDMPVCPYTLSRLPQLRCLDLCLNEGLRQLPHGPWPALERLNVDSELIDAALDDPPAQPADAAVAEAAPPAASGHALWSMHHLTHLSIMWDWEEEENEEKKQAIRRLLPQLQRID